MTYKTFQHSLLVLVVLGLVLVSDVRAQDDDRIGTAAMEELMVPITPRTVSLGATLTGGLGTLNGVEALQSNPAALMLNTSTSAMFSRMEYVADIGINYFGVAQRFGNNNFALTVSNWDYGDIARQTETSPEIQDDVTWSANSFVIGLTYARQFTDRIAAGVTFKGLSREIDDVDSQGIAFDAGMTYLVGESGLRFGVSLKNFGPQMGFSGIGLEDDITGGGPNGSIDFGGEIRDLESELPSMLNFGASYTRDLASSLSATFLANFRANSYDLNEYAGGVEFGFQELIFVRGGLNLTSDMDLHHWAPWNAGVGLNIPLGSSRLAIDYAYRPSDVFDGVNVLSASFQL